MGRRTKEEFQNKLINPIYSELILLINTKFLTAGQLSEILGQHRVTTMRKLDSLVDEGFLTKQPDKDNKQLYGVNYQVLLDLFFKNINELVENRLSIFELFDYPKGWESWYQPLLEFKRVKKELKKNEHLKDMIKRTFTNYCLVLENYELGEELTIRNVLRDIILSFGSLENWAGELRDEMKDSKQGEDLFLLSKICFFSRESPLSFFSTHTEFKPIKVMKS